MGIFSREDRKDLLRVRLAENPLTQARERIAMKGLLEADDRLLGINQKRKESPEDIIYKSRFVDEDKEYTIEEEKHRSWLMSRLWDKHEFMESFSFTYSLASHKTKWLEEQYDKYYSLAGVEVTRFYRLKLWLLRILGIKPYSLRQ